MKAAETAKGGTPKDEAFIKRMRLRTHADIYDAQSKITRLAAMGKMPTEKFRSLIYSLHLMHQSLDRASEEAKEKNPEGGRHHGNPLAHFYGFPDKTQEMLFEFYNKFWFAQFLKSTPPRLGESEWQYKTRLMEEHGLKSDWSHYKGLPIDLIDDAAGIKKLCELMRSEVEAEGGDTEEGNHLG